MLHFANRWHSRRRPHRRTDVGKLLGNWQTTVLGIVGGVLIYLSQLGVNFPMTGQEWVAALAAAFIAAMGLAAKDATTGSAPK